MRTVGAVVRQSDGLILGSFCCAAPNQALTVAHVLDEVENSEAITLYLGNEEVKIERYTIDRQSGIASIVARLPHALPMLTDERLAVTSTVYVAGWPQLMLSDPHSGLRALRTSIIRTLDDDDGRLFEVQGVFPKGFSGAAVLDEEGRLSGVLDELCAVEVGPCVNFSYGVARRV